MSAINRFWNSKCPETANVLKRQMSQNGKSHKAANVSGRHWSQFKWQITDFQDGKCPSVANVTVRQMSYFKRQTSQGGKTIRTANVLGRQRSRKAIVSKGKRVIMAKVGIQWQLSHKGKSHRGKKDTVFGGNFGRHLSQKGKWAVANVTERHLSQLANDGRHLG